MNNKKIKVGWICAHNFPKVVFRNFGELGYSTDMRISNIAKWLNANSTSVYNEIYLPEEKYDIVVFFKSMLPHFIEEAKKIQAYGGKVIFDANVNYYEIWGDYFIPDTKPTAEQKRQAIAMTQLADFVVADSSYILEIVKKYNKNSVWIPDNVKEMFLEAEAKNQDDIIRIVWSGIAKKSLHFKLIENIFPRIKGIELILVSDEKPAIFDNLQAVVKCSYIKYSDKKYLQILKKSDIIISPKILCNGYELGHSEYKITLGMAVGLPAIASPQKSYVEAIEYAGGGIICEDEKKWLQALNLLVKDKVKRIELGKLAKKTVAECYATPVVAKKYMDIIHKVFYL